MNHTTCLTNCYKTLHLQVRKNTRKALALNLLCLIPTTNNEINYLKKADNYYLIIVQDYKDILEEN